MDPGQVRADVLRLLLVVPRAAEQPHPGGASELEIAALEHRLGETIPAALADWLRVCKGEAIGPGGVFGARPDREHLDIVSWIDLHPPCRVHGWLPVAGDGCGNLYVLVARGDLAGCVGFVDIMDDPDRISYLVASDLWRFLRFLLLRETGDRRWPFDRSAVLAADPKLAERPAQSLPWAET